MSLLKDLLDWSEELKNISSQNNENKSTYSEEELKNYGLTSDEIKLVQKGLYNPWDFEEEDFQDDDYYNEDEQ